MEDHEIEDLIEIFILDNEPCVGFFENKVEEKLNMSIYDFQDKIVKALKVVINER